MKDPSFYAEFIPVMCVLSDGNDQGTSILFCFNLRSVFSVSDIPMTGHCLD